MHKENHSDPSQEFTGFAEYSQHREMDRFEEQLTQEELAMQFEYFPSDEFLAPEEPEREKRKPLYFWLRRVIIVLAAVALLLTVTARFRVQVRIGLEDADHDSAQLHLTVSGTEGDETPVIYVLYCHGTELSQRRGTLEPGVQLLTLDSLLPDTVYRIDIYRGEAVIRSFFFNTLAQPQQETQPTEPAEEVTEPTEGTTESTEEPTEPTEVTTEPTEETAKPTGETTEPTEETSEPTEETTAPTQPTYIPPATQPATEPETEPPTEPETEPATEPETEPATEPATEPETEPATEPTT